MAKPDESLAREDTFPKLLLKNARVRGDRVAYREKDFGIWQSWTWAEVLDEVRALTCGLAALGVERGDTVTIVGDNRPQLYWAFAAIQSLGAVPVPLYQDSGADEMQYVLEHGEVRFAVVEDQEQTDKLLSIMDRCPKLEAIVYEEPRGMRGYTQAFLHEFKAVQEEGRKLDAARPEFFLDEIAKGKGEDLAIIAYTSGTTGDPKGVMLSFDNLVESARLSVEFEHLTEKEEVLSYMPMAWIGDHFFSYAQALYAGFAVNCPESSATVMTDLNEIGPTYYFAPPAVFENILTNVMIRMEDAGWLKRKMFHYFIAVAGRVGIDILERRAVPVVERLRYWLGRYLVYEPLKNTLGFTRIRVAYTAGAPMGPEVFRFYRSLGFNLKQLYGQTECCAYCCIQPDGDVRPDTVGPPAPGCEIRIDEQTGEVLYKSPGTFIGYFKNPEATAQTKDEEGWVHTGDAGIRTDDGHLKIIDRAKDVGKLTDGTLFAPQYIENKLKFFPQIKEAVVHGNQRDRVTAFINIDLDAVGNWAERRGLSYTSYTDLAGREEVYELIRENVEAVNRDLARDSELSSSQIRRFLILHKELDADDGELTRTRKVRRRIIADRYEELIEALYSDRDQIVVEAQVTFEDGRQGVIKADLKISEAETFEPLRKAG